MKWMILAASIAALPLAAPAQMPWSDSATRSVLRANYELPPSIWKEIVQVQAADGRLLRCYLIFKLHDTYFSYFPSEGSRRIWPVSESATSLARAAMNSPLVKGFFGNPGQMLATR